MPPRLAEALAARLGVRVASMQRVTGGDINEAFEVRLAGGDRIFVKTHERAPTGMFPTEARGLVWLAEAGAIRVPRVVGISEPTDAVSYLALEYVASAARSPAFDERLGRGLAALHRAGAPHFGFDEDNFIGPLPQINRPAATWPAFYAESRILPQVRRAVDGGRLPREWTARFDALCARLGDLLGAAETAARLHGDLWSGNVISDEHGSPVVIDPAVYGGHREVDLAMLQLFGRPSDRLFAAYDEVWPREPGHQARVPVYQLYPLLVHVNLFGGSYAQAVDSALRSYE
jgi:fructosamine-3-kinase